MKYQIWYATAYIKIKPYSEISLIFSTILHSSFIAKPLPQTTTATIKQPK